MELPYERVGPYVRALQASLNALAPNDDHVPLSAALAHLEALDPVTSGRLLIPAEYSIKSGMPSFAWMERAIAEAKLARQSTDAEDPSDAKLKSVAELDQGLATRMRDRRQLHQHLRRARLLPTTRLTAAVRRLGKSTDFSVRYDRMVPDSRWLRIRFEVRVPSQRRSAGPLVADAQGRLKVGDSLQHFITRHFADPLVALHKQLEEATDAQVFRLSRSLVGPFWFPGVQIPTDVPPSLGKGLMLHVSSEVVAEDVHMDRHLDPWIEPPKDERPPDGLNVYRERRFAANPAVLPEAQKWAERLGFRNIVVPIARNRRRDL